MRRFISLLLLGLAALGLASCKPRTTDAAVTSRGTLKADFDRGHAAQVAQAEVWFKNNLLTSYAEHGVKDPRWDELMRQLLEAVAHVRAIESAEPTPELLGLLRKIELTPCSDPFFNYLCARYDMFRTDLPRRAHSLADAYVGMKASRYGALQKYYSAFRAGFASADRPDLPRYRGMPSPEDRKRYYNEAIVYFQEVLQDAQMYPREAANCIYFLAVEVANLDDLPLLKHAYESVGMGSLNRWPEDPDVLRSVGSFHIKLAWAARGSDYASKVTAQGWKGFEEELTTAASLLKKSWAISPHSMTATHMISVVLGLGGDRRELDSWFDAAMELDPNNDTACSRKLNYLQPKWGGSHREMIAFGKKCIDSKWGGSVPIVGVKAFHLVALDLPEKEDQAFCRDPATWAIMSRGYHRYFASVNAITEDPRMHAQYAVDAARATAWKEFLGEVATHQFDVSIFGGEQKFLQLLEEANASLAQKK